jgi:lipid-A-disaccharide synthase-like uncharacterized protein
MIVLGIIGLCSVAIAILSQKRKHQDMFHILGSVCLLGYSIFLGNVIFIVLQSLVLAVACVDFYRVSTQK